MAAEKTQRQSNIELLRILTMCGVITLHYNNPLIGGGIAYAEGINKVALYFIESLCVCAVDLFMIISGYFMCVNNRRDIKKPFELIMQVIIFSTGLYMLRVVAGKADFSITALIRCFIPTNYFAILYVAVYFISPAINIVLAKVNKKSAARLLICSILLFSVWPTLVDILSEFTMNQWIGLSTVGAYGSQWGYTIVNFTLMYFIGAYIRVIGIKRGKTINAVLAIAFSSVLLVGLAFVNDHIGFFTERSAWEYCNPVVIFIAVMWFVIFKDMNIGYNRVINEFAKAAFTVFLLQNVFFGYLYIEQFVQKNLLIMLLHLVTCVAGIYFVCWIVYEVYSYTIAKLITLLFNKIPVDKRDIYRNCFDDKE